MIQKTDVNYNFCLVGAATDVGKIRLVNEDNMSVFETTYMKVFVVCDGMGGHAGGQMASQTAITTIRDFLTNSIIIDPREAILKAIISANEAILNRSCQQPELAGMGSTCVILIVTSDGKVFYGHVGDSRIYIIANHRITQLTKDHSYVQTLVDAGLITKEQAEHHPRKNEITNALGFRGMQSPTVCHFPIEPESGNCFLLCSDGLTGMVSDEQINRIVSKHNIPIQQRAEKLIEVANKNGGVDNITVELVEFAVGTKDIGRGNVKTKQWKKMLLFIIPFILLLTGGITWRYVTKPTQDDNIYTEACVKKEKVPITYNDSILFRLNESIEVCLNHVIEKEIKILNFADNEFLDFEISTDNTVFFLKWVKEFTDDNIIVSFDTDSIIYDLKIPIKYQMKQDNNTVIEKKVEKPKPIEITLEDTIFIKSDNIAHVQLSKQWKLLKKEWDDYVSVSHPEDFKVKIKRNGELTITCESGNLPKEGIVISCRTTDMNDYKIKIELRKSEESSDNKESTRVKEADIKTKDYSKNNKGEDTEKQQTNENFHI